MNYASLTTQIINYANRSDAFFLSQVPDFINQGINRIYSEAKSIGFEIVINGNFIIGTAVYPKPANWRETISWQFPTGGTLLPRNLEFCQTYWPDPLLTALPKFYSDWNGFASWFVAPTPNINTAFQIIYLGTPLFNAENPTNFLTDRYPCLLLYACLREAMIFLKNDERVATVDPLYKTALQDINLDTANRYTDRTSKRDKD